MEPFPPPPLDGGPIRDPAPRKPGFLRKWGKRVLIGILSLILLQFISAGIAGAILDRHNRITETVVEGKGPDKLAVVEVRGTLLRGEGGSDPFGSGDLIDQTLALLDHAEDDEKVKGVLLVVDSPGGGLTESDEIHHALMKLREKGKKIVAHMGDLAASGGYYIACGADEILAQPTTVTGSIGVIAMFPEVSKLAGTLGVHVEVVKSGPMKDMGSFLKPLGDEERKAFETLIDEAYERFLGIVWNNRKGRKVAEGQENTLEYWHSVADGRIYTADQAVALGLVDAIAYREEAIERLRILTGLKEASVVEYHPPRKGLLDLLGASVSARTGGGVGQAQAWLKLLTPRILALWTGR